MHEMTKHYLICALWSSTGDNDEPLDAEYGIENIAPKSIAQAEKDCLAFLSAHASIIGVRYDQAGHDFWLTRNGHGAGFWDGDWPNEDGKRLTAAAHDFGETDLYVGDDGRVYLSR